jgi:hypothetical protein
MLFSVLKNSQTYTYGQVNSGWEEITDNVIKIGHITFDKINLLFGGE